ncbi:MAG: PIG-L family deacetylase [Rhodocyclaceae bacterium]|jgi:LmbE family N-acetylglucosaminyl deacetylase|nr:PIG-L family deacetylase [Rhodocyclaceae bacterium]
MKKQMLLRNYRRQKRLMLVAALVLTSISMVWLPIWLTAGGLVLFWLAHEAWLSDHVFYSASADYHYEFASDWHREVEFANGIVAHDGSAPANSYVLEIALRSTLLGYFRDPRIVIDGVCFEFERGTRGRRYVCLQTPPQQMKPVHCQIAGPLRLHGFQHKNFATQRLLVIAPHADDAELAAFGLYSQTREIMIVTLTQGEIEAEKYQRLGLSAASAAALKGRLRSWDSMAIPLWGNVAQERCVQLGYCCMQLGPMRANPNEGFPSLESGASDTRPARIWNKIALPSDRDGSPNWTNLVCDLRSLLECFQPDAIITPDPELDPHPDHIAATQAIAEAVKQASHRPSSYLLYANHLHNNDRWPMGPAGGGIGLPPRFVTGHPQRIYLHPLTPAQQLDKAMALGMQHDLQEPLTLKKVARRIVQRWLTGREWPATGSNEYFRKAVRSSELFRLRTTLDDTE